VHIGGGVLSANLACSGARTYTRVGDTFKPGIDFYSDASGRKGQALALQEYAATHNVKAVVLLIGANNYGFADIVQACVANWLTSPSWWKNYCHDDSGISSRFTAARVETETENVRGAIMNVATAMTNAGYQGVPYTILAQTYTSPIPYASGFRYPETGWTRQSIGGCGVWNRDANWAQDTVVRKFNDTIKAAVSRTGLGNVAVLDAESAFTGRRLCENTVGLLEERGVANWTSPGAVNVTEWVSQIRTVTTIFGPYQLQEGGHPSYWGQLALRNCLRLAYNGGAARGGRCTRAGNGLNSRDREPGRAAGRQADAAVRGPGASRDRGRVLRGRDVLRGELAGPDDPDGAGLTRRRRGRRRPRTGRRRRRPSRARYRRRPASGTRPARRRPRW
jgi:hypothetical protein